MAAKAQGVEQTLEDDYGVGGRGDPAGTETGRRRRGHGVPDGVASTVPPRMLRTLTEVVSALGRYRDDPAPDVTDIITVVEDLQTVVRRDLELGFPVRRLLGRWAIVRRDLIPLACLLDEGADGDAGRAIYEIAKVVVMLTMPLSVEMVLDEVALSLDGLTLDAREAFAAESCDSELVSCPPLEPFAHLLQEILAEREDAGTEGLETSSSRQNAIVNTKIDLLMTLLRNLVHPPLSVVQDQDLRVRDASSQLGILGAIHRVDLYACLTAMFSSDQAVHQVPQEMAFLALETFALSLRHSDVEEVAASLRLKDEVVEQSAVERRKRRLQDLLGETQDAAPPVVQQQRWTNRFGGLYKQPASSNGLRCRPKRVVASIRDVDVLHRSRTPSARAAEAAAQFASYVGALKGRRIRVVPKARPKRRLKVGETVAVLNTETIDQGSTAARAVAVEVLDNCFHPLVSATREWLWERRNDDTNFLLQNDRRSFLFVARFFLAVQRLHASSSADDAGRQRRTNDRRLAQASARPPRSAWLDHAPVASVLDVHAVFIALDCAVDAIEEKQRGRDVASALSALTEMVSCLTQLMQSQDPEHEKESRRAWRILSQILRREDLLRLGFTVLSSFSTKHLSIRVLYEASRLVDTVFDALRHAPAGSSFTILRRRRRVKHGKMPKDCNDAFAGASEDDDEEDEPDADFLEEDIDVEREFSAFADARVVANLTLLIHTVYMSQQSPDLAHKFDREEDLSSLLVSSGTARFAVSILRQLWSLLRDGQSLVPHVSVVGFFHLRTLTFFEEVLDGDTRPDCTKEDDPTLWMQIQTLAYDVLQCFVVNLDLFPSLYADMFFLPTKGACADYNRMMRQRRMEGQRGLVEREHPVPNSIARPPPRALSSDDDVDPELVTIPKHGNEDDLESLGNYEDLDEWEEQKRSGSDLKRRQRHRWSSEEEDVDPTTLDLLPAARDGADDAPGSQGSGERGLVRREKAARRTHSRKDGGLSGRKSRTALKTPGGKRRHASPEDDLVERKSGDDGGFRETTPSDGAGNEDDRVVIDRNEDGNDDTFRKSEEEDSDDHDPAAVPNVGDGDDEEDDADSDPVGSNRAAAIKRRVRTMRRPVIEDTSDLEDSDGGTQSDTHAESRPPRASGGGHQESSSDPHSPLSKEANSPRRKPAPPTSPDDDELADVEATAAEEGAASRSNRTRETTTIEITAEEERPVNEVQPRENVEQEDSVHDVAECEDEKRPKVTYAHVKAAGAVCSDDATSDDNDEDCVTFSMRGRLEHAG